MIERLSIVVPGLLAAVRAGESRHPVQAVDSQVLRRALQRCQRRQPISLAEFVSSHLGWQPWQDAAALAQKLDLPVAGAWLFAAPVALRPEHAGIYLLGSRPLSLSTIEAEQYCSELNTWLQQDGMRLYPISPHRWLLALPEPTGLHWHGLADAIGMDLRQVWPHGEASLRWQSRLTEWQMLLNQSALNQARQQRGAMPVHSLWLWGDEQKSANPQTADAVVVTATDSVLAMTKSALSSTLSAALQGSHRHLLVVEERLADAFHHGDVAAYQRAFGQFEQDVLLPAMASWQRGEIAELALYPDDDYGYLQRRDARWRFWQRVPQPELLRSR